MTKRKSESSDLQLVPEKIPHESFGKKKKKKKKKKMTEIDRLSNLPSGVTQHILSRLPIRDAVRTCVLSSNWRYQWNNLPCLVFNNKSGGPNTSISFEEIVEHVFFMHSGPIDKFKLSVLSYLNDIDRWILYLSRKSVKEFIVEIHRDNPSSRTVISNLFALKVLTHLELSNCLLNLPSFFKGLRMLKSLHFRRVRVCPWLLDTMISCSPLLKRVILSDVKDISGEAITHLNIDASNLQFLIVRGDLLNLKLLKNTSSLVDVSIGGTLSSRASRKLLLVLFNLPRIERLTLGDDFFEFDAGSLAEKLHKPCPSLKHLSLSMRLNNVDDISTVMLLLRSSPALQELEIMVRQGNGQATNWLADNQNCTLTKLRRLKLCGFSVSKAEVNFIKSLLLCSPSLQQLEIAFGLTCTKEVDLSWLCYNQNSVFNQLRRVKLSGFSGVNAEVDFIRSMFTSSPMLEKMALQPATAYVSWELAEFLAKMPKGDTVEFLCPSTPAQGSHDSIAESEFDSESDDSLSLIPDLEFSDDDYE